MKRLLSLLCFATLAAFPVFSQQKLTDKELASVIWAMGQMYPEGFTVSLDSLRQPTKGIAEPLRQEAHPRRYQARPRPQQYGGRMV